MKEITEDQPRKEEAVRYAVSTNYGEYYLRGIEDATTAIAMLAPYHNLNIEIDEVKQALCDSGCFERFPLSAYRCEV